MQISDDIFASRGIQIDITVFIFCIKSNVSSVSLEVLMCGNVL